MQFKWQIKWIIRTISCVVFVVSSETTNPNPTGYRIVDGPGTVTIKQNPENPNHLIIQQENASKRIIEWNDFSISPGQTTQFIQPDSNAITLNRVIGQNPSTINGNLTANGNVWILNQFGIQFGPHARVDVGGLLASTAHIENDDFMNGKFRFIQNPHHHSSVIVENGAEIKVRDTGMVTLVAPGVSNRGLIIANLGKVNFGSGDEYTVDLYGDGLIHFHLSKADEILHEAPRTIENEILNDAVHNSGHIIADGGNVVLSASEAKKVVENVIKMDGIIEANTAIVDNAAKPGEIILLGTGEGKVKVDGTLACRGGKLGQGKHAIDAKGGTVKVLGEKVTLFDKSFIDVSGNGAKPTDAGAGTILIGGSFQGKDRSIPHAKYTAAERGSILLADGIDQGKGGEVIIWSDNYMRFYGSASVRGGEFGGPGGLVETSAIGSSATQGGFDLGDGILGLAPLSQRLDLRFRPGYKPGKWLLDPQDVTISNNASSGGSFDVNDIWVPTATTSNVNIPQLEGLLNGGALVTILTHDTANGDIEVQNAITVSTPGGSELDMGAGSTGGRIIFDVGANLIDTTQQLVISFTSGGASFFNANMDIGSITLQANGGLNFANGITITSPLIQLVSDPTPLVLNPSCTFITNQLGLQSPAITVGPNVTLQCTGNFDPFATAGPIIIQQDINFPTALVSYNGQGYSGQNIIASGIVINTNAQPLNLGGHSYTAGNNGFFLQGTNITINSTDTINYSAPGQFIIQGSGNFNLNKTLPTGVITNLQINAADTILGANQIFDAPSQTYNTPIDGGFNLTLAPTPTAALQLNNNIGGNTPLASFSVTATNLTLNNPLSITTTGAQVYNTPITGSGQSFSISAGGTVTLNSNISGLTTFTLGSSDLILGNDLSITTSSSQTYNSPIDGAHDLTLSMGANPVFFQSSIGGGTRLTSLALTTSQINLTGDVGIFTTNSQNYTVPIDGTHNLTLDAAASTVTINTGLGNTTPLSSFTAAASDFILGTSLSIITTGAGQTYNAPVDGAVDWTLDAGAIGTLTFNANVGGNTALSSMTVVNTNNFQVNNNAVITTGAFTQQAGTGTTAFGNSIVSASALTIVTGTLTGSITAPAPLTLTANNCNITGTIGGLTQETISGQFPVFLTNFSTAQKGLYFFNGMDIIFSPTPPTPPTPPAPSPTPSSSTTSTQSNPVTALLTQGSKPLQGLISAMASITAGLGGGGGANQSTVLGFGQTESDAFGTVTVETPEPSSIPTGNQTLPPPGASTPSTAVESTSQGIQVSATESTSYTTTPVTSSPSSATTTEATSSVTSGVNADQSLIAAPSSGGVAQASESASGIPGTGEGSVAGEPVVPGVPAGTPAPTTPLARNAPLPPSQTANLELGSFNRETHGPAIENLETKANSNLDPFGASRTEGSIRAGGDERLNLSLIADVPEATQRYTDDVLQKYTTNTPLTFHELNILLGSVAETDVKNLAVDLLEKPGSVDSDSSAFVPNGLSYPATMKTSVEVEGFNASRSPATLNPIFSRWLGNPRNYIAEIFLPIVHLGITPLTPEETATYDSIISKEHRRNDNNY